MTLEPGGFRSQRGLKSMLVSRKRKMPKDDPKARVIFLQELLGKRDETAAGRALKIAEFFQRHRRIRVAPNAHRFGVAISRESLVLGNSLELLMLCTIEHRAAPKGGQCDTNHNYKRQIAFHP
jgi:hypothetical protein